VHGRSLFSKCSEAKKEKQEKRRDDHQVANEDAVLAIDCSCGGSGGVVVVVGGVAE
jgi:hypothetical protein